MNVPRESERIVSYRDPATTAADQLNELLEEVAPVEEDAPLPSVPLTDVEDAKDGPSLIPIEGQRDRVRLLLITRNVSFRQLGSLSQKRLLELSGMFAEIHVLILNERKEETTSTVRLRDNVWLYSTDSRSWWRTGLDAYRIATTELIFAGVFRADVIVAEDPFDSALVAYALGEKYDRPFEIHVLEDVFAKDYGTSDPHHLWRSFMMSFTLPRADAIRTNSAVIKDKISDEVPEQSSNIEVLPVYHNLETWRDMTPAFTLKDRYPQFNFVILHVSQMQGYSHTREVLHGVAPILRSHPTIGMVIIGNGPYRAALEKQVIALGIQSQVEFEPVPDEVVSHMKSASILIHLSESPDEDITVLQAASVKLPIVGSSNNIAGSLFVDGESAYICPQADPACVSHKLREFLRDNAVRIRFAHEAEEIVFERIERDYTEYLESYRDSIERCMLS